MGTQEWDRKVGLLGHVQSLWGTELSFLGQLTRIAVLPGTAGGARLALHDPVGRILASAPLDAGPLRAADFLRDPVGTDIREITVGGTLRRLDAATLDRLATAPGQSALLHLDGQPWAGNLAVLHSHAAGGTAWLVLAPVEGRQLSVYALQPGSAALTPVQTVGDGAAHHLSGVVAMADVSVGGQAFLLAASSDENGVSALRIGSNGRISPVSSFGAEDELPIRTPTAILGTSAGGNAYAILASAGSSSLTVLSVSATGTLGFVGQVNDSLGTRFAGVTAIDSLVWAGQTFVAAGGTDGGVSLFQLLPDGRLVHRDTLVDGLSSALDGITDLRMAAVDGRIEIFVMGAGDRGLARLAVEAAPGAAGRTTAGADLLIGAPGGSRLDGGNGADLLVDGSGADSLRGGEGEDIFVFLPDGSADRILDFDPARDRIDLTGFAGLRTPAGLTIAPTATGATLRWQDEVLTVTAHDQRPLSAATLAQALCFVTDRVGMPDSAAYLTFTGTAGTDTLAGTLSGETFLGLGGADWILAGAGSDSIDGGAGTDMLSYGDLPVGTVVDLAAGTAGKGADRDRIGGIENVTGSALASDYLTGDARANLLRGLGGYDWFIASAGADTYDGGSGRDMVTYATAASGVTLDLGRGQGVAGPAAGHRYVSVERATGSVFADIFYGAAGDDEFRGLGGYDWFIGSAGRDSHDGGSGLDMVAYTFAGGGVSTSLLLGRGWRGDAARDSYAGIENLSGSSHADVLIGDHGRNLLRGMAGADSLTGLGGNDRLVGGPGDDWLDGGPGYDYAEFSGRESAYAVSNAGPVTIVSGPDGIDRLTGIEVLVFADGNDYL